MKIENAKKIEVWQFETELGDFCFKINDMVFIQVNHNLEQVVIGSVYWEEVSRHFAELEAKEQEQPASPIQELPEYTLQLTLNEDYLKELIRNEVAKLEAKYEHLNEAMVINHKNVTITKNLVDSLSPQRFEILEQRIESLESELSKPDLPFTDLRIATLEQEQPTSTTDKLLEVIHKLEKRIEDLEEERATLVVRTNDIYNRLNTAKLSL